MSQILQNQLVIMEALSQLLPSRVPVQVDIAKAISDSVEALSSIRVGANGRVLADEAREVLHAASHLPNTLYGIGDLGGNS